MAQLKKHCQGTSLTVFAVLLAAVVWWKGAQTQQAFADPEPPVVALTQGHRSFVERVLAEVSLDRDALVALNPSSQSAESLLTTVRTWSLSNQSSLDNLIATVEEKTHALYQIEKAIGLGPFNESHAAQLSTARSELSSAKASYRSAFGSLESSVNQALSNDQRTTWTAIKTGHGPQMPYRMLALEDAQRISFSDAQRRYKANRASASNQEELDAAVSEWSTALAEILTDNQESAITSYQANYTTASNNVTNAWNNVLAVTG